MSLHKDSKSAEMLLDHMEIAGVDDRDQQARLVVRTMGRFFGSLIE